MGIFDTLGDVTQKMEKLGIAYMLSGGVVMGFYATIRSTFDINIVIGLYQ